MNQVDFYCQTRSTSILNGMFTLGARVETWDRHGKGTVIEIRDVQHHGRHIKVQWPDGKLAWYAESQDKLMLA